MYVGGVLEGVVDEPGNDGGLANVLVSDQNDLEFAGSGHSKRTIYNSRY